MGWYGSKCRLKSSLSQGKRLLMKTSSPHNYCFIDEGLTDRTQAATCNTHKHHHLFFATFLHVSKNTFYHKTTLNTFMFTVTLHLVDNQQVFDCNICKGGRHCYHLYRKRKEHICLPASRHTTVELQCH